MNTQDLQNNITVATDKTFENYKITVAPWATALLTQKNSFNKTKNKISSEIQSNETIISVTTTPKLNNLPILDEDYLKAKSDHTKPRMKVQPLRDKNDIERAKVYFHDTPVRYNKLKLRDYLMFIIGLNTARRGGDIGKLQVKDFFDKNRDFKTHLIINEGKTGKKATILIHPNVKEAMIEYLNLLGEYRMSDYLFANYKTGTPLTTNGIWKRVKKMQTALDLDINLGSHSMRKTYAYQAAKNNPNDSATEIKISDFLNHGDVKTTHIYTQAGQDEMDEFVLKNGL